MPALELTPQAVFDEPVRDRGMRKLGTGAAGTAGFLALATGDVLQRPSLTLCGAAVVAACLCHTRLRLATAVPAAALFLLVCATTLGVLAGLLHVDLLASPLPVLVLHVALCMMAASAIRRPRPSLQPRVSAAQLAAYVPAGFALVIALFQALRPAQGVASWALIGTDLSQHTDLLAGVQRAGSLSYGSELYPRGLHMLLALVDPRPTPDRSPQLLAQDLQLMGTATWLSLGVLLTACANVTIRLAEQLRQPRRQAEIAAGIGSLGLLTSTRFQISFIHMGAAPSMLAVVVLWWLALCSVRSSVLTTCAICTLLLANLWQALVAAPAAVLLVAAAPRLVRRRRAAVEANPAVEADPSTHRRHWMRQSASAAALGLSLPALVAVSHGGGLTLAAIPGATPGPSGLLVLLTLLALCSLPWLGTRRLGVAWASSVGGLIITTALLLVGAGRGFDLTQYYPQKGLWFLVLFSAPLTAACTVGVGAAGLRWVIQKLGSLPTFAAPARKGLLACVVLLIAALAAPGLLGPRSIPLDSLDRGRVGPAGERELRVATTVVATHPNAVVVPVAAALSSRNGPYGPYILSKLLAFQTGQAMNAGAPEDVCRDVQRVAGRRQRVVIVTDLSPRLLTETMKRLGCVGPPVVQLPDAERAAVHDVAAWLSNRNAQRARATSPKASE